MRSSRNLYRNTLIATGLSAGLGMSAASVASDEGSQPPSHSGAGRAGSDFFVTSQTMAKMFGEDVLKGSRRSVSDTWVTSNVKRAMLADDVGKGFDLSVDTIHGAVALIGALANRDLIDHVRDIVQRVHGVKSVDTSSLTVAEP